MSVPGIGPIISSAMVAAIGNGDAFFKGRGFAAWLGLVPKTDFNRRPTHPRQDIEAWQPLPACSVRASSVGRADQAARAGRPTWPQAMDRSGQKAAAPQCLLAIALANKLARIAWSETSNPTRLTKRLKQIFPSAEEYDRPVHLKRTYDLQFLPYKDKGTKLPDLLRRNKKGLAKVLLALDRTDPLTLMMLTRLQLSAQDGRLVFTRARSKRPTSNWAN